MDSFGRRPPNTSDSSLREDALEHLSHAVELGAALHRDMVEWWAGVETAERIRVSSDGMRADIVLFASGAPQTTKWRLRANDVIQNYRLALDSFTRAICRAYVGPGSASDVAFPTAQDEMAWSRWPGTKVLPEEVVKSFRAMQPLMTGRPYLAVLRRLSNLGKHEFNVKAIVTLVELNVAGSFVVEGVADEAELASLISAELGGGVELTGGEQVIASLASARKILEVPETGPFEYSFSAELQYDGEAIPLIEALNLMGREVAWTIAYISGQWASASTPAEIFKM